MADFRNGCEDTVLGVDEDKRTKYSKEILVYEHFNVYRDEITMGVLILCEGCGIWMIVDENGHVLVK